MNQSLWIGSLDNSIVVHDTEFEQPECACVMLFHISKMKLGYHPRLYLRAMAKQIKTEDPQYASAVESYQFWKTKTSNTDLATIRNRIAEYGTGFQRQLDDAKEMHKTYLSSKKLPPAELIEPRRGINKRVHLCHSCKFNLSTIYQLCCSHCGWMVCAKCGACGCGWATNAHV
jgi:hypothetical protein